MDKIFIKNVEIIKNTTEPYLKYTIIDLNNKKHIIRVKSLKQLKYIIEELKILDI